MSSAETRNPAKLLTDAADRIRDLASESTNGTWDAADTRGVWSNEEKRVAVTENRDDARWIAALSPATAAPLEQWLRAASDEYEDDASFRAMRDHNSGGRIRDWHVTAGAEAALEFARAVLGKD